MLTLQILQKQRWIFLLTLISRFGFLSLNRTFIEAEMDIPTKISRFGFLSLNRTCIEACVVVFSLSLLRCLIYVQITWEL